LAVFAVSAAWHGPTLNFLLWGLFHGTAFVIAVLVIAKVTSTVTRSVLQRAMTIGAVLLGRLLFMDRDVPRILHKGRALLRLRTLGNEVASLLPQGAKAWAALLSAQWPNLAVAALVASAVVFDLTSGEQGARRPYRYLQNPVAVVILALLVAVFVQPVTRAGFVYGR
jgi:D-alanyl-lipoteichoic acid acyltransferase DltB (MBOAT superfamily)